MSKLKNSSSQYNAASDIKGQYVLQVYKIYFNYNTIVVYSALNILNERT